MQKAHCLTAGAEPCAGQADEDLDELPPWARKEKLQQLAKEAGPDLPFPVYLLASAIIAIAAVSLRMSRTLLCVWADGATARTGGLDI